ncbi:MAG: DNA-directed RNA polymerase subunit beta' [Coriobacteriia bacterium]|nr:DNA-directed RNA polymerase subunit beta' [Coriobacteriia bacterium]
MSSEFDVNNIEQLRIGLASPEKIRSWSRGEVKKPETINYRTLKPERDGLFCEKIFGPSKDWECACGKYKRIRFKGIICERCGVEVTKARVRRERMGHIELATPVSHIWYFKGTPSRLGYLLDIAPKELEKVLYYASSIIISIDKEARDADATELRDELVADLEALDAELDRQIDSVRRLSTELATNDDGIDEDEMLTPEQIEVEVADLREEYEERKELRNRAYETFMSLESKQLMGDDGVYREMRQCYRDYFLGGIGAEAIKQILANMDLDAVAVELREIISDGKGQKRVRAIKRLKVVDAFIKSQNRPEDMILDVIPVIPPDLRPMVQLDGGRFATSDLNDLYRRVINRNNRLKRLLSLEAPEIIVNNEKRMLQEAVDSLFDNGRRGRPVTGPGNRPLKSISDMLKGKQGRFRQNLLGKRVDYSGRSVIVVGPQLKIYQCGLPKIMALELFKPQVVKRMVELDYSPNVKAAKKTVDRGVRPEVWDVLEEIIAEHPVLLNRAPTLHRLGIQAFEPVLVEGKAIRLHPLVCTAFNADFDGDQMAVHVPLSSEAQAEARILMLSTNNIKSPAHGRPLAVPTQDMVIGLFYLTASREGLEGEHRAFMDFKEALNAYDARAGLKLQSIIYARLSRDSIIESANGVYEERYAGERIETTVGRIIFNAVLPDDYPFVNYEMSKKTISRLIEDCSNLYSVTEMSIILDGLKDIGFHYATQAGVTVSVFDATVPPSKPEILAEADAKVAAIENEYQMGFLDAAVRHREIREIWTEANDKVGDAMAANFDRFNPIYMMAYSGARGDIKQVRQLAGMRGLMSNPKGETIERPIKANFREGLSVLEYFISTHGARKGLADTALRTADSGYLTRRLVDVAQDVIVREHDCQTDDGMVYDLLTSSGEPDQNLIGRCLMEPAINPETEEVILDSGDYISSLDDIRKIVEIGMTSIQMRTIMTCHAHRGVCQKCYGWDLATSRPVNIGTAVGIIAAQSIGEPGTQLTMRTFHTGGVAGEDITHGLPRVTELFEARRPKGQAILAEISGTLHMTDDRSSRTFTITDKEGNVRETPVSSRATLLEGVVDGAQVVVGQQLTKGSVNPHDLLRLTDVTTTLRYITSQVQEVYISQGVDINDKHIEVIARQMLRKVAVTDAGDSDYLPGKQVDFYTFQHEATRIANDGGNAPTASPLLLGITKASLATESYLSAASFQETTKVLTDAAIEGKSDELLGLKENVIIGKPIPAGTGLKPYRDIDLTYKGEKFSSTRKSRTERLPEYAPSELKEWESLLPPTPESVLDGAEYLNLPNGAVRYLKSLAADSQAPTIPLEILRLYIFDDLSVSQRWANKFNDAGIETVGDLIGKTEEELLRIEGIGAKAIAELKAGLEARDLLYLIDSGEDDEDADIDISDYLNTIFSPDDDIYSPDQLIPSYRIGDDDDSDDDFTYPLTPSASTNGDHPPGNDQYNELFGLMGIRYIGESDDTAESD